MARRVEGPWYRRGKGTWYATVGGTSVSLKVRGEGSRPEAVAAWHRLMAGVPAAPTPSDTSPPGGTPAVTVRSLADAFLADAGSRCKPESMCLYRSAMKRFCAAFGGRAAASLKPPEVERAAARPDWRASTRGSWLAAIRTAFRWAARAGLLAANPLAGMRIPPGESRGASRVLTPAQFDKLSKAAAPGFRPFLRGLWLTGCRPGELAAVTAADVDFDNEVAVIPGHKTAGKTGKPRYLYLPPEAVKLLRPLAKKHPKGPLFRNSWGNAWNRFTTQKAMAAARAKAKLPHAICYGLRHSFATRALAKGVPDAHVAALLGHSGTAMLHKHYSHLTSQSQALKESLKRVE